MGLIAAVIAAAIWVAALPFICRPSRRPPAPSNWLRTAGATPDLDPDALDEMRAIGAGLIGELPSDPTPAHVLAWLSHHQVPMAYASRHGFRTAVRFETGHLVELVGLTDDMSDRVIRAATEQWVVADSWATARNVDLLIGDRRLRHLTQVSADLAVLVP